MPTMILDPDLEEKLRAQRAAWGGDRYDEVWEGVYMMMALPKNEHQRFVARLTACELRHCKLAAYATLKKEPR